MGLLSPLTGGNSSQKKAKDKNFIETFQPGGKPQTSRGKTCAQVGKIGGKVIGSIWGPIGGILGSMIGEDLGGDLGDFTKGNMLKKLDLKDNFKSITKGLF